MPTVFDANLMFVSDGNASMSVDGTSPFLKIDSTPVRGMSVRVHVPTALGSTPTLDLTIRTSTDGTNIAESVTPFPQITAAGSYERRFETMRKYVAVYYNVGSATTTPNFGVVEIGLSDGRDYVRPTL